MKYTEIVEDVFSLGETCHLLPLSAIAVTLNGLEFTEWCQCSECEHFAPSWASYCPNCGAKVELRELMGGDA